MAHKEDTRLRGASVLLVMHLLVPAASCVALGPLDKLNERLRNDPHGTLWEQYSFVRDSRKYAEEGADRAEIIETLAWIAMNRSFPAGADAVRALVYLAHDLEETQLQEALLSIVVSDVKQLGVRSTAVQYLELSADRSIRTRLLDYIKNRWCSFEAVEAGNVLFHYGDPRYLKLLDLTQA